MPLGTREVLLVLRAKDEVTRTLGEIGRGFGNLDKEAQAAAQKQMATGAALMGVGAAIGGVGAAGIAFFANATGAAREFNKEAALTLTQVDQVGVTIEDLKTISKNVAKEIPAPFEQLQASLFDIFSSMDVNLSEAQVLLEGFARAAVAGNTDVQTAGRATIAILNGFGIPAEEVNRVLDVQFQLVRKGVGTYEEFASAIGRSIPSAARAGQEVETLAGMMAFLTRNGLSVNMAATSAARALDAFSNPIVVGRLEEMGVKVRDARGEFLQMPEIIGSLKDKLGDLTGPQMAEALQSLFKGAGGTIQARRFIDPALRLFDEFDQRVTEMKGSAGAMDNAYDIMFEQPQNQIQLLKNNLMILKTEIGDALAPTVGSLVKAGLSLVQWFNDLSPGVKQAIVYIGAATAVFMTIAGVLIFLVGAWMAMSAAATMAGVALLPIIGTVALIAVGIIALIAVVVLIIKHWDTLKGVAVAAWDAIKAAFQAALDFMQPYWEAFWNTLKSVASTAWGVLLAIWDAMGMIFTNVLMPALRAFVSFWEKVWDVVVGVVQLAWRGLKNLFGYLAGFFDTVIKPALSLFFAFWQNMWNMIGAVVQTVWFLLEPIFKFIAQIIGETIVQALGTAESAFSMIFGRIGSIVTVFWTSIFQPIFSTFMTFVTDGIIPIVINLGKMFINAFEGIANIVIWWAEKVWWPIIKAVWAFIMDVYIPAIKLLAEIFGVAFGIIVELIKVWWQVVSAIFMTFLTVLQTLLMPVLWVLKETFERVFSFVKWIIEQVWNDTISPIFHLFDWTIRSIILPVIQVFSTVWSALWDAVTGVISAAWNNIIQPIWQGIQNFINDKLVPVFDTLAGAWARIWEAMSSKVSDIWDGIKSIVSSAVNVVIGFVEGFVNGIIGGVNTGIDAINKLPGPDLIDKISTVTLPRVQMAIEARAAGGGGGGGAGMSHAVAALQLGGRMFADMPYWVGEAGRELFVPNTSGTLIPESKVGGITIAPGAVQITVQGSIDRGVLAMINAEIEETLRRLAAEITVRT